VILIDAISVSTGEGIVLEFEEVNSEWRQGVWLGIDGMMEVAGQKSPTMQIWEHNSPRSIEIKIIEARGPLHIYNIWDRGRGISSQANTSGMIVEEIQNVRRYRCQSISIEPHFRDMTFVIRLRS
jgi:hypothetical protein